MEFIYQIGGWVYHILWGTNGFNQYNKIFMFQNGVCYLLFFLSLLQCRIGNCNHVCGKLQATWPCWNSLYSDKITKPIVQLHLWPTGVLTGQLLLWDLHPSNSFYIFRFLVSFGVTCIMVAVFSHFFELGYHV